ncbi:endoplasmic reticulum aminopeptidase 1 [Scaptodrosophila lebanonensis]|uniref:Aminopeptidase n=1 Tax=Drosophila lebanonensis TaxID=7225 RepID=A0A6J2T296_DROLE|nr:endoplasmic reticulum aminopeptidase 1 [Scaptodrosophila lebanonensis]
MISLGLSTVRGEFAALERPLRLPNDTYPLSYQIHISSDIHLGDLRFNGNATIDIEIRQTTHEIVLHAKELKDLQISVRARDSNEPISDLLHTYDPRGSFLIIYSPENYQKFKEGERYIVEIIYRADMQKRNIGLYWMTYETESNQTVYAAATQAEPTYTRLIFPCYDEPAFKSNFTIKVTHSANYTAISNMPVHHVQQHGISDELATTIFYATPPMSTYLVAFVISDFENITAKYRGVTQRIYTSPATREKGERALKNAVRTVAAFEDYFGISYPLEKLDHVALMKNYGAAMENWGLITYKEDNIIQDHPTDIYKSLKDTLTQNHEIAHQWFGNLVSPQWWTYAWMNEGFATYFGYLITDLLYPEQKVMEFFITEIAERAYTYNYLAVRPMTHYVEKESDIMSLFDIITYQRAACVIKMFHHAFHQKTFVRGISHYLQKFQYTVANEMKLFDSLQTVLLEDERFREQSWVHSVPEILLSWTHSEWIPILSVTRNYENGTITFSQHSKHSKRERWWIPLNFATLQSPDFEQTHVDYFMPPQSHLTLTLEELGLQLDGRDWLIVNKQQTGFYHVLYDVDNLRAIASQLQQNHTLIHAGNRAAIFQDLTSAIEHNEIESVEVVFELLKYLEFEEDLTPWNLVADTIEFFRRNLFDSSAFPLYKLFVRRLVSPTFHRRFHNSDPRNTITAAALIDHKILEMACMADLQECLDFTHNLARDYMFKRIQFQNDHDFNAMYDTVLCLGVRYLSDEEFGQVLQLLQSSDRNSVYYDDLIYSLRCTQNREHLFQYLNILLGENTTHHIMNNKESMMYLYYLFKSNMAARPVVWNFFEQHYKLLCQSQFFVDHFNRIAEYMPQHQRAYLISLHESIAKELKLVNPDALELLIDINSGNVGKKIRNTEQFLDKFELRIHKWLVNDNPTGVFSASLNVVSGSARPDSLWRTATQLMSRALHVRL